MLCNSATGLGTLGKDGDMPREKILNTDSG